MPQILALTAELQAKLLIGNVSILKELSVLVRRVRESAEDGVCVLGNRDPCHVCWHDAAWATPPNGQSQGAWTTGITDRACVGAELQEYGILEWGSRTLRRVARSSLSAEEQAAKKAESVLVIFRYASVELQTGTHNLKKFDQLSQQTPAFMITDARALYDAVHRQESSCLGMEERRASIEVWVLKERSCPGEVGTCLCYGCRWLYEERVRTVHGLEDVSSMCSMAVGVRRALPDHEEAGTLGG